MIRRWDCSSGRKMILSGLLLMLILIRHTVDSYQQNDYGPRKQQNHQKFSQQNLQSVQQHPHLHSHRHHHEYLHNSNREMHKKSQTGSHFYRGKDYRATKKTVITTTTSSSTARTLPRTPSSRTIAWKWSSTTAANLRLAELTHISHQDGNETSAGSTAWKNRLSSGESQQWSANNKQIYIGPFREKIKSNASASTSISMGGIHKPTSNHANRSSWSHYSHPAPQLQEPHLLDEDNHHTLLEKTSRMLNADRHKMSQQDRRVQSIPDKDEYDYYYDEDEESEEATSENNVAETKGRQNGVDEFNYDDYPDDEPNIQNDDPNISNFDTESLTAEKWKNYGTAEAVERSRRRYTEGQLVDAHIQRIKEESKCRWPHPKVIRAQEDASTRFVPHCTIVHVCGDDTGCCNDDAKMCVAKTKTTVYLHFFVSPLGRPSRVEVRPFENHTECHCVERCRFNSSADSGCSSSSSNINYNTDIASTISGGNGTCRCPRHFDIVQEEFARGRCRCDCYNNIQACNTLKRGEDGFPSDDQRCISEEKCQMPTCQYGRYSTYSGRCPKVKHQKRTISRYNYR